MDVTIATPPSSHMHWLQHLGLPSDLSAHGRNSVRTLIVISCSSRGGSSVFSELLRTCDGLRHFRGEISPFLRQVGLAYPSNQLLSDELRRVDDKFFSTLEPYISWDIGHPCYHINDQVLETFISDIFGRLCLQWPAITWNFSEVTEWVQQALAQYPGDTFDYAESLSLFRSIIRQACNKHNLSAAYYDGVDSATIPEGPPENTFAKSHLLYPWYHGLVTMTPINRSF